MVFHQLKRSLLILVTLCLASACSSIPESLQVVEGTPLTNFSNVRENAAANQGNLARWGGVIAKVTNNADNTMLEVVHFSLSSSTRPKQKDETQGRFKVYFSGLLDPMIYKEGRSITALGKVAISEDGKIGDHEYTYPVINASKVHLWKDIKKVDVRVTHDPFWYTPSYWHYPRPYYRHPIVVSKPSNNNTKSKDKK